MGFLKTLGNIATFGLAKKGYEGYKHSQEKKKRRHKREVEKVQEAQKVGLKTQEKQYDVLKDIIRGEYDTGTSLKGQRKDYERALRYSEQILEPQRERMLQEAQKGYERFTRPGIAGQYQHGPQGSTAGSSALNQALSASAADLANQVTNQFQNLQFGLAEQFLSKRDTARQDQLKTMYGIATGGNQIATGVAGTQVPQGPPSLGQTLLPIGGAVIGGVASGGNPAAVKAGYDIGQGVAKSF